MEKSENGKQIENPQAPAAELDVVLCQNKRRLIDWVTGI